MRARHSDESPTSADMGESWARRYRHRDRGDPTPENPAGHLPRPCFTLEEAGLARPLEIEFTLRSGSKGNNEQIMGRRSDHGRS